MPTSFGAENGRSARVGLVGVLERPPFLDLFAPDVRSSSRTMTHAVRLAARRPLCARTHLPPRLALARLPPTPTPPAHVSSAQNVDGARAPPGTRHTVSGGHPASAIARPRALAALLTSWQCPPATEIPNRNGGRQQETGSNQQQPTPWPAVSVNANGSRAEHGAQKSRPDAPISGRCWLGSPSLSLAVSDPHRRPRLPHLGHHQHWLAATGLGTYVCM